MPVADSDPRLEGIREQYARATLFLREASESHDPTTRFRKLMASVYFARAVVELMLESAEKEVVKVSREDLENRLVARLPGYALIEAIRIHDFHRFGVLPRQGMFMGGMVKLRAQAGHAAMAFGAGGPTVSESGRSRVIQQRALHMAGDRVFDDESGEYVAIDVLVTKFLGAIPETIDEFRSL